jgi:hypothetical protein
MVARTTTVPPPVGFNTNVSGESSPSGGLIRVIFAGPLTMFHTMSLFVAIFGITFPVRVSGIPTTAAVCVSIIFVTGWITSISNS